MILNYFIVLMLKKIHVFLNKTNFKKQRLLQCQILPNTVTQPSTSTKIDVF